MTLPKLQIVSAKDVLKAAQRIGFYPARQSGSHIILKNPDGRRATVPNHRIIKRGTLLQILKTLEITKEEFEKLLD